MERIFSYYTQIKTARRYNLDVSTVDALIRIRFNGPRSLTQFDTLAYAWKFLEKHARPDDSSKCMTRMKKSKPQEETEPFFGDDDDASTMSDQLDLAVGSGQGEPDDAELDDSNSNDEQDFGGALFSACAGNIGENGGSELNEFEFDSSEEDEDLDEIVREMEIAGQT